MRITTILNQKGGTGKSTTAHALAARLAQRGLKALVIDADDKATLSIARAQTRLKMACTPFYGAM